MLSLQGSQTILRSLISVQDFTISASLFLDRTQPQQARFDRLVLPQPIGQRAQIL